MILVESADGCNGQISALTHTQSLPALPCYAERKTLLCVSSNRQSGVVSTTYLQPPCPSQLQPIVSCPLLAACGAVSAHAKALPADMPGRESQRQGDRQEPDCARREGQHGYQCPRRPHVLLSHDDQMFGRTKESQLGAPWRGVRGFSNFSAAVSSCGDETPTNFKFENPSGCTPIPRSAPAALSDSDDPGSQRMTPFLPSGTQ